MTATFFKFVKFFGDFCNFLTISAILPLCFIGCVPYPPCPPAPPPEKVIVREYVPVPAPEPQIPQRPVLPSSQLIAPTIQELVKALLADRELLTAWALDLETRLKAYLGEKPENIEGKK